MTTKEERFRQELKYGVAFHYGELWRDMMPLFAKGEYVANELQVLIDRFEKATGRHGLQAIKKILEHEFKQAHSDYDEKEIADVMRKNTHIQDLLSTAFGQQSYRHTERPVLGGDKHKEDK